jgi:hypothetical protein
MVPGERRARRPLINLDQPVPGGTWYGNRLVNLTGLTG